MGATVANQLRAATADDVAIGDAVVLGTEPHDSGTALTMFQPTGA